MWLSIENASISQKGRLMYERKGNVGSRKETVVVVWLKGKKGPFRPLSSAITVPMHPGAVHGCWASNALEWAPLRAACVRGRCFEAWPLANQKREARAPHPCPRPSWLPQKGRHFLSKSVQRTNTSSSNLGRPLFSSRYLRSPALSSTASGFNGDKGNMCKHP